MHWAIRVDNTFFELKRYPGQSKPGFERNLWEWHKIRSITTQELYGYTSMNDAEIEAVGLAYIDAVNQRYDLLDNNCQRLADEVLHHVIDPEPMSTGMLSTRSTYQPAGAKIGSRLAAPFMRIPRVQRASEDVLGMIENVVKSQYDAWESKEIISTLPRGGDFWVQAVSDALSKHSGRALGRLS